MKKLLFIVLTVAVLACGLAAPAEQGGAGRFAFPRIVAPTVPPIEVPEIPEIEVPKVPTAAPTKKPKIEVPEIPDVNVSGPDVSRATAEAPTQVEAAMAALGISEYSVLYDALSSGEALGDGSRGDAAKGFQQMLVAFGQALKVDGIVGPKTIAALNAVQDKYELPRNDALDAAGFAALLPLLLEGGQEAP